MNEVGDAENTADAEEEDDGHEPTPDDYADAACFQLCCDSPMTHVKDDSNEPRRTNVKKQANFAYSGNSKVAIHNRFEPLAMPEMNYVDYGETEGASHDILEVAKMVRGGKWVKVTGAIDSGCVDHVFPPDILGEVTIEPSPMSKAGKDT